MISRPIREGFRGVGRHMGMAVSSAIAVTITLLIISIFGILTWNVRAFTQNIESSLDIYASVEKGKEDQESVIKQKILAIDGVESVEFSTADQEFDLYLKSFDDEKTREAFEPLRDRQPMHDAFYVEISDGSQLESVADQISQIEGVKSVNFGGSSATTLVRVLRTIRYGGAVLAIALSLLAVALISNTIKLTISARADEIAIMRNVGAKNSFIRSPFLVEGVIIGAMGSIIPMLGTYFGYRYLYQFTGGYVISQMFSLLNPVPFVRQINVALLLIGMAVGFLGSFFSVTRYLRWKR